MKRKVKLLITLLSVLCLMLVVYVLDTTVSRYIRQERDEVYATYTALKFESNITSGTAVLEDDVAYFAFQLRNYEGEDITKRAINYSIKEPSFVDVNGKDLTIDSTGGLTYTDGGANYTAGRLFVKDVWGDPKEVGEDTNLYEVEVVSNDANTVEVEGKNYYNFPYETGTEGTAATHSVVVKVTRKVSSGESKVNENISVVVHLSSPYTEVYIINLNVVEKLITYSAVKKEKFAANFVALNIQSANVYSHNGDDFNEIQVGNTKYRVSPEGFKTVITFDNIYFNKLSINSTHAGISSGGSSNEDLSKTYLESYDNDLSDNEGSVIIYVPQSSDFTIELLPLALASGEKYKLTVVFYINLIVVETTEDGKTVGDKETVAYSTTYGGYSNEQTIVDVAAILASE